MSSWPSHQRGLCPKAGSQALGSLFIPLPRRSPAEPQAQPLRAADHVSSSTQTFPLSIQMFTSILYWVFKSSLKANVLQTRCHLCHLSDHIRNQEISPSPCPPWHLQSPWQDLAKLLHSLAAPASTMWPSSLQGPQTDTSHSGKYTPWTGVCRVTGKGKLLIRISNSPWDQVSFIFQGLPVMHPLDKTPMRLTKTPPFLICIDPSSFIPRSPKHSAPRPC